MGQIAVKTNYAPWLEKNYLGWGRRMMTQAELHDERSAILLTGRTQLLEHGRLACRRSSD